MSGKFVKLPANPAAPLTCCSERCAALSNCTMMPTNNERHRAVVTQGAQYCSNARGAFTLLPVKIEPRDCG